MDRRDLLEYSKLIRDEKDLDERIAKSVKKSERYEKMIVTDTVFGSRGEYDIYGPIGIEGIANGKYAKEKKEEEEYRQELERTREEIRRRRSGVEKFIRSIPEGTDVRRIVRYKCEDGLTWQQVAQNMGEGYTADGCRKAFNRYIKKPGG